MEDLPGTAGWNGALIVANPTAGSVSGELVKRVEERCRRHLPEVRLHWTGAPGDARRLVREAVAAGAVDLVIAVGGDGTVREVVEGLVTAAPDDDRRKATASAGPALLVVPAGTGNSNYLAHWGDLPWPQAVDAALTGVGCRRRRLDLAWLVDGGHRAAPERRAGRDRLVVLGAASGTVAQALMVARELPMRGRPRYQAAFSRACRDCRPYPGRVIVDGVTVHEGGTILTNTGGARYRGGTYRLLPHSVLDDGLLDVCVVSDAVRAVEVPELVRSGGHVSMPGVAYARGRRVAIVRTDGEPLWFEHDGELLTGTSASFTLTVLPGVLPVMCRATSDMDSG